MSARADRLSGRWVLAAFGVAALILAAVETRRPSPPALPPDRVSVVSSMAVASAPVRRVDPPAFPDWTGPERGAVVSALHLPIRARLRDLTGTQAPRQVLCGRVQAAPDQPFRRFTYVKTAKLGAVDDGGSEFAQAYAQLCGQ
jgi:hypothetical protein